MWCRRQAHVQERDRGRGGEVRGRRGPRFAGACDPAPRALFNPRAVPVPVPVPVPVLRAKWEDGHERTDPCFHYRRRASDGRHCTALHRPSIRSGHLLLLRCSVVVYRSSRVP
jgi:hypothetical protein